MSGVHEKPFGDTREWFTPPELFDALGLRFDLDPASPMSGPVPWVPADRFYSPNENGLVMPWEGRVWLNPPYGPPLVPFVHRMVEHGNGVMLVPARTETRWFQYAAHAAHVVNFLADRLHFTRADGFRGRASHASVVMAFGMENAVRVSWLRGWLATGARWTETATPQPTPVPGWVKAAWDADDLDAMAASNFM